MAHGDAEAAAAALESAFAWHDGLPIPFEFGRTQLVAGEVHRRCRRRKIAAEQLRGTVESNLSRIYRKLGIRSRTELARSYEHGPGP